MQKTDKDLEKEVLELREIIKGHFPFSSIRPAQERALEAIARAELKNKRFIILELPTGVGKSGIAYAISSWASTLNDKGYKPGAYILTTQKTLQRQYMRDFADKGMVELKGAANYRCNEFDLDCSSGSKLKKILAGEEGQQVCTGCPYKRAKYLFTKNPIGVTNFAYFLNETKYVNQLEPRSFLIIDEAHNSEKEILGFADIEITKSRTASLGIEDPPIVDEDDPDTNEKIYNWIYQIFDPAGATMEAQLLFDMKNAKLAGDDEATLEVSRKHDALDKFLCKVRRFDRDNYKEWFIYSNPETGALYLKPTTANLFSHDLLFSMGKRIVMMSATILDKATFCRNLGIDPKEAGFLRLESDFPVENRRIFFTPVGKMGMSNIENTMPKMLKKILEIMNKHPNEKGIIHCQSYKIQKAISEFIGKTKHKHRLLAHGSGFGERDQAIETHNNSEEPTILLSPSMTEGLDLKDDLSRWQIICKIPYPYLGDKFIKYRLNKDPKWYQWMTALVMVQATGRSIRSKEDYSMTYVLDSDFGFFLHKCDSILPQWWKDSIVYEED